MQTTSRPSFVAVILCLYVAIGAVGHGDALRRLWSFAAGPHAVAPSNKGQGKSGGTSLTQQRHLLLTVRSDVSAPAVLNEPPADLQRSPVALMTVPDVTAQRIHLIHEQPSRAPPMTLV